ncbi:hypothetical protein HDU96_010216 [Phlyctochytrium bullatum]|nr:hypothetical protein HDU96_010216 [Phlyctochytrium bullatum]
MPTAPFNIEESTFLVQPRLPATDDLYPNAMSLCSADADKAQLALGCKYLYSPQQWLMFWRKAEGQSAKAGLRCVIQVGTVFAVLTGRYKFPQGEVKLNKSLLRQGVVETKMYDMATLMGGDPAKGEEVVSTEDLPARTGSLANRIRAATLSTGSLESGPKVIVVEGDTLNVALQLRRIFKHTPAALIPINGFMPGGFYRRGGPTPEEEICRRSNLWDCLDDPYKHSIPERNERPEKSLTNLTSNTTGGEGDGYPFLKNPGRVSCICVVPDMNRDNIEGKERNAIGRQKSVNGSMSSVAAKKGSINGSMSSVVGKIKALRDKDIRMSQKAARAYARKIEFALKVAITEGRRVLVLSALGCGAHGTPPKHAAEIYKDVLANVDPRGEYFDLIAFAILEDQNSFRYHNPEGNIRPFAEVLTNGVVTPFSELEATSEVTDSDEVYNKFRSKDSVFGRNSKETLSVGGSNASSKETLNNSNGSLSTNRSLKLNSKTDLKSINASRELPRKRMGVDKLSFLVAAVSSFEEDYPPEELLTNNHTPLAKGWRSERFCIYPQTIILKLAPGNCRVRKIQVLSHHFMIATKLEFYIGRSVRPLGTVEKGIISEMHQVDPFLLPAPPWNQSQLSNADNRSRASSVGETTAASEGPPHVVLETVASRFGEGTKKVEFTRLGYVSLSDNAQSQYRARELKSIHIDAEGDYIKINCGKNFINTLNLYNQIGIVAINILGEIKDADYFVNSITDDMKTAIGKSADYQIDPLLPDPEWQPPHDNTNAALWGAVNPPKSEKPEINVKDLAFSIYHDEDIAKLIEKIVKSKDKAVQDYPLAKAFKTLYHLAKKAGEEIARLLVTKAQAVKQEDYELAEDIKSVMEFTEPYLHNKSNEVREAAVKVVVELVVRVDEDSVLPFLKDVKPQLLQVIKDKIQEARGKVVKHKPKKRPPAPWKENPLTEPETSAEVVDRLKEEINALKDLVEHNASGGRSAPSARAPNERRPDGAKPKANGTQLKSKGSSESLNSDRVSAKQQEDEDEDEALLNLEK